MTHVPAFGALVLVLAVPLAAAPPEPLAIVYGLSGPASVKPAEVAARRPAQRFEWLAAGTEIAVDPGGTLLLAFADGSRYELRGGAKATLMPRGGLGSPSGPVRALASVSPLPRLEGLAADARAGSRAGAVRLRGLRIAGLYPRDDASVLPNEALLSFTPLPGAPRYKVQVEDETGNAVFDAQVAGSSAVVSPGVLKPGARYHWTVRTLGASAPARGEADFVVLAAESLAAREELRRSLQEPADAESLALLAEVDSRLGLLAEARRGFEAARAKAPDDAALAAALERVDRQMNEQGGDPRP
jgi:hypothetical protein